MSNAPSLAPIRVSVAGASGYAGGELVRLLATHPGVEIVHLAAGSQAGQRLDAVYPSLGNLAGPAAERLRDQVLVEPDFQRLAKDSDAVFLALPHGLSLEAVPVLLDGGARVIDLGGDFRLKDPAVFAQWYGAEHTATHLLEEAVYGLPELHRQAIRDSRLVANPGCYPTAAALALLPLAETGLLAASHVVVDAKSGVSGAGRQAKQPLLFGEVDGSLRPYGVLAHRHQPEMEQILDRASDRHGGEADAPTVSFVPHLVPMVRGILASCYARPGRGFDAAQLEGLYRERYAAEPFVRFLGGDALPATKNVAGSNFCEVAIRCDPQRGLVVAMAAIDNLGRGAATAAVANFNLQWGLHETTGLVAPPLYP